MLQSLKCGVMTSKCAVCALRLSSILWMCQNDFVISIASDCDCTNWNYAHCLMHTHNRQSCYL